MGEIWGMYHLYTRQKKPGGTPFGKYISNQIQIEFQELLQKNNSINTLDVPMYEFESFVYVFRFLYYRNTCLIRP